jgi:hypothetical protein
MAVFKGGGQMEGKDMIPPELIESKILLIRGKKVMLDHDLAVLYGVTTGNLNKAVRRNIDRFPEDFMFQLADQEFKNLIFQFGTSSWGGIRKLPRVFTNSRKRRSGRRPDAVFGCPTALGTAKKNDLCDL